MAAIMPNLIAESPLDAVLRTDSASETLIGTSLANPAFHCGTL
jgi:hypothetical protein